MSFEPRPNVLTEGAGETAPTAPHATLRGEGESTGPERFWQLSQKVLWITILVSLFLHWMVSPWSFLPTTKVEIKDQDGELLIPADLFEAPVDPPPQQRTQDNPSNPTNDTQGNQAGGSGVDAAITKHDAAANDAASDGGDAGPGDASETIVDDGGIAYVSDEDGGGGTFGRDPESLLGGIGKVSAGPNKVTVLINFEVIRSHPLGPRLQPILAAIPEWKSFMSGSSIDAYRDTDWMLITGPSLLDTSKDAVFIHYSASDAEVDKAIASVAAQYAKGGPIDTGTPGVKGTRFYAHGAERVFLRPRSKVVLIVPSTHAKAFAQAIAKAPLTPRFKRGEAISVHALDPGGSISFIPKSIQAMDLYIVPRNSDGGADGYAEGTCPDPAAATQAADDLKKNISGLNSLMVKLATAGVLNGFEAHAEGNVVKAHLSGSKDQVESIVGIAGSMVGVSPPPKP